MGFLDNTKANFDRLTGGIGELLRERHGVKTSSIDARRTPRRRRRPRSIAEMGKECDLVFAGSAD